MSSGNSEKKAELIPNQQDIVDKVNNKFQKDKMICSSEDPTNCYSKEFVPTNEWQVIKEGQILPAGLDYQMDLENGIKLAKLASASDETNDSSKGGSSNKGLVIHESDNKKIVGYNDEYTEDDNDIKRLKASAGKSNIDLDVKDAIKNLEELKDLEVTLDSLIDHSHNLKDGILISEHFDKLIEIIEDEKSLFGDELKELALRIIAQSLRHNPKALANIDTEMIFTKFFKLLNNETNTILQKRILGVISSLIQNSDNVEIFNKLNGEDNLLSKFDNFKQDSQLRILQILDDVKVHSKLSKRSLDEFDLKVFEKLQNALTLASPITDETSFEILFDKLCELKDSNSEFKPSDKFINWLVNEIEQRKLVKRDGGEINDDLYKKLLTARHVVFGNPNALRKALADEL